MGRNNADFKTGIYHGSDAEIPVGGTVEARGSYVDGNYSTEPEHRLAFATPNRNEARDHGKNVYEVKYQDDEEPETVPGAPSTRFISRKGFTVVKKVK